MLSRVTFLAAAFALPVTPAAAQMREAALTEVFESYNDCFAATRGGSISVPALEGLGWKRATVQTGNGEPIQEGPVFFGHPERAPLIILNAVEGEGFCMVNARIESFAVFEEFKQAFGGQLPKAAENGAITFLAEGQAVQIAPTGSREAPALRLAVFTPRKSN